MTNKKVRIIKRKKDTEERSRLEALDAALRSESVREHIRSVVTRVREQLARRKDALMSWEPFPLNIVATTLPPEIRSAWVFVLRAGADTGAERHRTVINA